MEPLVGGIVFSTYKVTFADGNVLVFRGQRDHRDFFVDYDFSTVLASEARFYDTLSDLPVPRVVAFHPLPNPVGFAFSLSTYLPGTPMEQQLPLATAEQRRGVEGQMGELMARIHGTEAPWVGPLGENRGQEWGQYFSRRLESRLDPFRDEGLLSPPEVQAMVGLAARLELERPRLLHLDFRPANLLAERRGKELHITGLVDAANSIGGDPAFDLARTEEGTRLTQAFVQGYSQVRPMPRRDSTTYLLYCLETACLLLWISRDVERDEEAAARRAESLLALKDRILEADTV